MTALDIVPLCDDSGRILRVDLADALCVLHRHLRPMLPDNGAAYLAKMQRVCHYGARLVAALDSDGRRVIGVASAGPVRGRPAAPSGRL